MSVKYYSSVIDAIEDSVDTNTERRVLIRDSDIASYYVVSGKENVIVDGRGATLKGFPINVLTEGVTLKNIRVITGDGNVYASTFSSSSALTILLTPEGADCIAVINSDNCSIENCSVYQASDELTELFRSTGCTIKNCLIADPINIGEPGREHPSGEHGYGLNIVGVQQPWTGDPCTINQNLFVRVHGRHPSVFPWDDVSDLNSSSSSAYSSAEARVSITNNVSYGLRKFVSRFGTRYSPWLNSGERFQIDYVGNVVILDQSMSESSSSGQIAYMKAVANIAPWDEIYQANNYLIDTDGTVYDFFEFMEQDGQPFRSTPNFDLPSDLMTDYKEIIATVTRKAGSRSPIPHPEDRKVLAEVDKYVGTL